jgi:alpha-L-rhamnosidase
MITPSKFPSYGWLLNQGATSLWVHFFEGEDIGAGSRNHHCWGDISHFFIRHLAGIDYRFNRCNDDDLVISPKFASTLDFAEGYHITPEGVVRVRWQRDGEKILLNVTVPGGLSGRVVLSDGWTFSCGNTYKHAETGEYIVEKSIELRPDIV